MDSAVPFLEELINDEVKNVIAMNEEEIRVSQEIIEAAKKLLEQRERKEGTTTT